ncbi:MAG: hypothetical protein ACYCY7_02015 [Gallionella sp.]
MTNSGSDFDAAKAISDLLKDMDKDRQQRVLRWVAESLDITLHVRVGVPHDTTVGTAGSAVVTSALSPYQPEGRPTDIKSFVESKSPKNDIQFATVIAYYYRFEAPADDRLDTISAEVLQNATRLAGHTRFAKPLMTLNNAKKQGYLDAADRGSFRINSVGENLVAMTLPGSTNSMKPKPNLKTRSKLKQRSKATKVVAKPRPRKS